MTTLPYSEKQLSETVRSLVELTKIKPERRAFIDCCLSLGWDLKVVGEDVLEFETPFQSAFLVDLFEKDSIAGGFIPLCFLDWNDYESEDKGLRDLFDSNYAEIVLAAESIVGKPNRKIVEEKPCQKSSIWDFENAFLLILQGADDIEGIDIRVWIEFKDGTDEIPGAGVFEWLCERHVSKIEKKQ